MMNTARYHYFSHDKERILRKLLVHPSRLFFHIIVKISTKMNRRVGTADETQRKLCK